MKKSKKIIGALLSAVLLTTSLIGCGAKTETPAGQEPAVSETADNGEAASDGETGAGDGKVYKIGVCQLVEHDALDASYQGFLEGLKEGGYEVGKNLEIDFQNAQNDKSNCSTIATKLVNDNNDLILAIATTAAQAVVNETSDIPVLFTAVTDPVGARLVSSVEAPGANVTGTSDMTQVSEQINLLKKLVPNAETVAMLYNSSEINSKVQIDMAVEAAEALGLKTIDASISSSNEIQQVVQSVVGKADAIYAPTDNMIASGMQTVALVAEPNGIPVIVGEEGMALSGGLATYGINYFNLGKLTGKMAARILDGEDPATMPVGYLEDKDLEVVINKNTAEKLGIEIPEEFKDKMK